ncbi:endonuclease/exonuclease/phosphatase family protein [Vibrio lamellibrachiae]|uniref:endonuclease/exonuclease/phosphatase family protein n=1 Tax=Vibrio lamellibrachiae TaxID=2910253 RepID=UPI003D137130
MYLNHLLRIFITAAIFLSFSIQAEKPLKIASWNIEWLTSHPSPNISSSFRSSDDYKKIAHYYSMLGADVLGFQEVNDIDVIKGVVGSDYTIWISDRSLLENKQHQFHDINQYTGFAVHKKFAVTSMPGIRLESTATSKLRFASYIVLGPNTAQPIHMLSVHLKAGCIAKYRNNKSCRRLKAQAKRLNLWIRDRELDNEAYIILGDFNHNLSYPSDWMWAQLTVDTQAALASAATKPDCKVKSRKQPEETFQYRSVIDHVVISKTLSFTVAKQQLYEREDLIKYHLSDHCPVVSEIHYRK